ncbi:MAG: sugar porter family MFS transporter [Kiritimatiellae bacterium]|nr:sugar porter family MFS transporter [Kiritimatiellia bacterium]MDD5519776.1 sugar porter family MFS transporter [Kiritimatiellia bacterium]
MKLALLGAAIVAALGGLLFGFDTAVISGTTAWLKTTYSLTDFMLGFTVSSALIGTIIGSIGVGRPADAIGRRGILFVLAVLYFVTAVGCALAWDWWSFVIFRFIGGLAVGGASVVSPMYIAEISPAKYRGRLVAVTQFNIVLGILLAYLSNYIISALQLGVNECRWMFGVQAAPALAFFLLLFFTPQSPRWLIAKGRTDEARRVFDKCGTDSGNIEDEIKDIQNSFDLSHHTMKEPFYCRKYLKPILLAVAIAMFNQLSGINALIYYTAHIFKMAGYGAADALLQSVLIGLVNLIFTMAAMSVIDHFGRKKLMLVGSIGYILSLSVAAYSFYMGTGGRLLLASLIVFIASHAFGQGAVIWVFISEVFPNRVRARGQALGSFTHWIMAAAISWTFPMIAAISGWMTFAFYAVCMVGQLVWVLFIMPETKGISLEKIQKELGIE